MHTGAWPIAVQEHQCTLGTACSQGCQEPASFKAQLPILLENNSELVSLDFAVF